MSQIHGSGAGNWSNAAIVDSDGRLFVTGSITTLPNVIIDGAKVRGSGLVVFPKEHDRVIQGNQYQAGSYFRNVPIGASGALFLCCGSYDVHAAFDGRTDGDATFELSEGTQVSNSGTILPIINLNRRAALAGSIMNATCWIGPTVTTAGDIIYNAMFLGGSGAGTKFISASVSTSSQIGQFILNAGSCYYFEVTNRSGRPLNADFNLGLHEHR